MTTGTCLYCPKATASKEHVLPAAFGEFVDGPILKDRICRDCNTRLGKLDEQLARSGPEAFFRRLHGVTGRSQHEKVNPFERGSGGASRLEIKAMDKTLGYEILLEVENGEYRQMRQMVFIEKDSRKSHCVPIREGCSPAQLRAAFEALQIEEPFDVQLFWDISTESWVETLVKETWPTFESGPGSPSSTKYEGVDVKFEVREGYFRALAKIGFHYFLTQFPDYSGHEPIFAKIRQYISDGGGGMERANEFLENRGDPLLIAMLDPQARPDGWVGHILGAEIIPTECKAHVQMFISDLWPAPVYTVRLANDSNIVDLRGTGHGYKYFDEGRKGRFSGEAQVIETIRINRPASPPTPVI